MIKKNNSKSELDVYDSNKKIRIPRMSQYNIIMNDPSNFDEIVARSSIQEDNDIRKQKMKLIKKLRNKQRAKASSMDSSIETGLKRIENSQDSQER